MGNHRAYVVRAVRHAPSRWAHCETCGVRLSYQVGSIMWANQDRDLCVKHEPSIVGPILQKLRKRLREAMQKRRMDSTAKDLKP